MTIVLVGLLVGLAFFCFDIVEERLHYWKQSAGMIVATCYACGRGIRQREHAFRYKHDYLCAKDMARKERIPISKDLRESPDYPHFDKQEDWRVCESFPPELLAEEPRVEKSFACRLSELVAYEIGFIHKASLGLNLHSLKQTIWENAPLSFLVTDCRIWKDGAGRCYIQEEKGKPHEIEVTRAESVFESGFNGLPTQYSGKGYAVYEDHYSTRPPCR